VTDRPLIEPESNNVSIATPHPSQLPSTSSLFGQPFSNIPTVTVISITATSTEIVSEIQSTTSISVETSVGDHTLIITPTTTTAALMTFTKLNTNTIRILTSNLEAYLMTLNSSPTMSFTLQSQFSTEASLPASTIGILTTVSTSSEQASPTQPVKGSYTKYYDIMRDNLLFKFVLY
jgi:hypothetical protein